MNKLILSVCITLLLTSCTSTKTATNTPTPVVNTEESTQNNDVPKQIAAVKTMLVGKEDISALNVAPFNAWYAPNYANYTVDATLIKELSKALKGVSITTFMGTWCGDSKRETPRMFKILDAAGFENDNLELITVDRTKQNPKEFTDGRNIIRVPTFIFERNGKEIGRIVERPRETLEADMLKILNGEPYKHSYEK